jgi:hypothetical protein
VTQIANQLLLLKNLRFGSIDRESTYLIDANNSKSGQVQFFEHSPKVLKELNRTTGRSTDFAVIVMRNEDKEAAQKLFSTPLIFSVKEAKGLEYRNIILFNFTSLHEKEFQEICVGVKPNDLQGELIYARAKDKSDKSLEVFKFYINSLYVAITRAIDNLYVVENPEASKLWRLIGNAEFQSEVNIELQSSSIEDWQSEASRLEKQGKLEQVEEIKKQVLQEQPVPWEVIDLKKYAELRAIAFTKEQLNFKAKEKAYEYTTWYNMHFSHFILTEFNYKRKPSLIQSRKGFIFNALTKYNRDNPAFIHKQIKQYGVNHRSEFNLTPLMLAAETGAVKIAEHLVKLGANRDQCDNYGRTAFMIMLLNAYIDPKYAKDKFPKLYPILCPESLKIGFENQVVVTVSYSAEFFVLNLAIAVYRITLFETFRKEGPYFNIDEFVALANLLPDSVIPAYRKKKSFIVSLFARNEFFRQGEGSNYRAFFRMGRGKYTLAPTLGIIKNDIMEEIFNDHILEDEIEQELLHGAHFKTIMSKFKSGFDALIDEALDEEGSIDDGEVAENLEALEIGNYED